MCRKDTKHIVRFIESKACWQCKNRIGGECTVSENKVAEQCKYFERRKKESWKEFYEDRY